MNRYEPLMRALRVTDEQGFLRKPAGPLNEEELQSVENELGFALPSDFRDFFTYYHGVIFKNGFVFPLREPDSSGNEGVIDHVFDTLPRHTSNIIYRYRNWIDTDPWDLRFYSGLEDIRPFNPEIDEDFQGIRSMQSPTNLLWIGDITAGNMVGIVSEGVKLGQIYYWINTPYVLEGDKGIYLVADSFDEFMHLLKPCAIKDY